MLSAIKDEPKEPNDPNESPAEPESVDTYEDTDVEANPTASKGDPMQDESSQMSLPPKLSKSPMTAKKATSPAVPKFVEASAKAKGAPKKTVDEVPKSVYARIYRAPPEVRNLWKEKFSRLPNSDESRNEFISKLFKIRTNNFGDSKYFQTMFQVVVQDGNEDLGRWWTYKEMCDTEGEVQTKEIAKYKSVPMRRNPRLDPRSAIAWPENQEFSKEHEWTKRSRMTNKVMQKESEKAEVDNEVSDQFDKMVETIDSMQTSKASNNGPTIPKSEGPVAVTEVEGMKDAMTQARKAHADWERKKRDFEGNIESSKYNENTKGCKFEKDLAAFVVTGSKLDDLFLNLEHKYNSKCQMAAADV